MSLGDTSGSAFTTFLCASGTGCSDIHPSCATSDPGTKLCLSCKPNAHFLQEDDQTACVCDTGKGLTNDFQCLDCHSSCETCYYSSSERHCLTCKSPQASLLATYKPSYCVCTAAGYSPTISLMNPPSTCDLCKPDGCPYCVGTYEEDCMSETEGKFVLAVKDLFLPYLGVNNNMICFRDQYFPSTCSPHPISRIISGFTPSDLSAQKCYKLLTEQWPSVLASFAKLFPLFTGPHNFSINNINEVKASLYLWILQFGYLEMDTWTDIKAAINAPFENWLNYEAWGGTNPGFTTDGQTIKPFPSTLSSWLSIKCPNSKYCSETEKIFRQKSTLCQRDCSSSANTKTICTYCYGTDSICSWA